MPNIFQNFLNQVTSGYRQADKQLGGWLPGGGTASPVSRAVQPVKNAVRLANVRDVALIPVLDKGLAAGVVPPVAGMYARFLSGTSNPLTELPPALQAEMPGAYVSATTPKQILNPEWETALQNKTKEKLTQIKDPVIARMFALEDLNTAKIPQYISSQEVIDKKGSIPIGQRDYRSGSVLSESLGRFWIDPETKEAKDRYDFNYYMSPVPAPSMQDPIQGIQMLLERNPRGAIPLADALGLIRPGAGYEIKAPLK